MPVRLPPIRVIPEPLARVVRDLPYWFVIGGHAVRCFCPYRPSRDVDFGVHQPADLDKLLTELERSGNVEILERSQDTVHLHFDGINVSIFVLENLTPYVEQRCLNVTGVLATKLHAILDRGTRRDFFDLYVTLHQHRIGIAGCLSAMREVHGAAVDEALLLRALTYFEDAEREARLPGEGPDDWDSLKSFFISRVGSLLVPPSCELAIERQRVDLDPGA